MATQPKELRQRNGGMLGRRRSAATRETPLRVLVASGRALDPTNRQEAKSQRATRQNWQEDAWAYRDTITELRYAEKFLANSGRRIRYFVGFYNDPSSPVPIPIEEATECPPDVKAVALDTLDRVGGPQGASRLGSRTIANFEVAGECWLFGYVDDVGDEQWTIRSTDEVRITNDGVYQIRDLAQSTGGGEQGWINLDQWGTDQFIGRMWIPHPRFSALADSPLRSMLDLCEELLITGRSIRAAGRSRLATAGFLKVPTELDIEIAGENDRDKGSAFMERLQAAMIASIADEGVASAVVPITVRGPADALKEFGHFNLDRPIDTTQAAQRMELLRRMANGLDLPAEVLLGMADLNHWTAWQVDDSTFRHHIEPLVIEVVDAWTQTLLWPGVRAALGAVDPTVLRRLCVWYDPTELVTSPDRVADAKEFHAKLVISDQALREAGGWTEDAAPDADEILLRMLRSSRSFPPNVVLGLFHKLAPSLLFPADNNEAGVGPGGFIPPAGKEPVEGEPGVSVAPPAGGPPALKPGPPPNAGPPPPAPPGMTSAAADRDGRRRHVRTARRMVDLDRDARARLQAAASAAVARALERAGAKIRAKVSRNEALAGSLKGVRSELVAATLGPKVVTAAGLNMTDLVAEDWSTFGDVWDATLDDVIAAQVGNAFTLAGIEATEAAAAPLAGALAANKAKAWAALSAAMTQRAAAMLYDPHPGAALDAAEFDPTTLVPTGMIRSALAMVGGFGTSLSSAGMDGLTPVDDEPMGQIATGPVIGDWLAANDVDSAGYEWIHGPAARPFEPHVVLDGVTFSTFDDPVLANDDTFPSAEFFTPGDHDGCTCDWMPLWQPAGAGEEGPE